MIDVIIFLLLLSAVFVIAELLYKKGCSQEMTRKFVHAGGGVITAFMPLFIVRELIIGLGAFFSLLLWLSRYKKYLPSIHATEVRSVGAVLFAPVITLLAFVLLPNHVQVFQGSVLVLGLSDSVANLVGRKGSHGFRITGPKTLEGSGAFFAMTLLIFFIFLYYFGEVSLYSVSLLVIGALVVTMVESVFSRGWDNLFIPVTASVVLYFIL